MKLNQLSPQTAADALRAVALPDVCRVEDLAQHLSTSPAAIRRALRRGEIPGRRVGKRWLVARLALVEWLAARSETAEPNHAPPMGPRSLGRPRRRSTPTGR